MRGFWVLIRMAVVLVILQTLLKYLPHLSQLSRFGIFALAGLLWQRTDKFFFPPPTNP